MTARLEPLGNDRIDAATLEPARFVDGGRRREDLRAPASHPREQIVGRQAEMEAHDRRLELREHVGRFGTERRTPGSRGYRVDVELELAVIGRERRAPSRLAFGARRRRRVAEEVDVERRRGLRADGGEPSPPAFDTAIASALPCTPAIGA